MPTSWNTASRAKPREPAAFDAPQIGTFLHYLLENVTRDVLAQGGFAAVDNALLHRLTERYIDRYVEQELHNFQNRNARFRYLVPAAAEYRFRSH